MSENWPYYESKGGIQIFPGQEMKLLKQSEKSWPFLLSSESILLSVVSDIHTSSEMLIQKLRLHNQNRNYYPSFLGK